MAILYVGDSGVVGPSQAPCRARARPRPTGPGRTRIATSPRGTVRSAARAGPRDLPLRTTASAAWGQNSRDDGTKVPPPQGSQRRGARRDADPPARAAPSCWAARASPSGRSATAPARCGAPCCRCAPVRRSRSFAPSPPPPRRRPRDDQAMTTRRAFLQHGAAAALALGAPDAVATSSAPARRAAPFLDPTRPPDVVGVQTPDGARRLPPAGPARWEGSGVTVETVAVEGALRLPAHGARACPCSACRCRWRGDLTPPGSSSATPGSAATAISSGARSCPIV